MYENWIFTINVTKTKYLYTGCYTHHEIQFSNIVFIIQRVYCKKNTTPNCVEWLASHSVEPGFYSWPREPATQTEVFCGYFSVPSDKCYDSALKQARATLLFSYLPI